MFVVFPGQGSQAPGMGQFLFENFQEAKEVYEEASEAISVDLKKLCFEGSESELQLTHNTQPALLVTSTATYRALQKQFGLKPKGGAGHSIGEYAALVTAGSLDLATATRAVRERGLAMQQAVPVGQGGMAAVIGLDEIQVRHLCQWTEEQSQQKPLSPANFNCPGQIVISGSKAALDWLKDHFKPEELPGSPKKAKLIPLAVSAPFHCALMAPAEKKMRDFFASTTLKDPLFPIIQNFKADIEKDKSAIKESLIRQISAPVLWTQTMQKAMDLGWNQVIEVGHGQVLKGLFKKMSGDFFQLHTTSSLEDLKLIESQLKAMGH